jgi:hypothetical protein
MQARKAIIQKLGKISENGVDEIDSFPALLETA